MKLKEYGLRQGLTQEEVAKALGMPKKTYQNYEREVREADSEVLCALADLYEISLDDLVGRGPRDMRADKGESEGLGSSLSGQMGEAMEAVRQRIAQSIKRFRNQRGLSVDEVGKAVGKSGKTVSAWEVGRGQPDADTLIALCRLFGVDITDFYGESGDVAPLSEEEQRLIDLMRSMTDDAQRALLLTARSLAETFPRGG